MCLIPTVGVFLLSYRAVLPSQQILVLVLVLKRWTLVIWD